MSHFYLPPPWPSMDAHVETDEKLTHHFKVRRIEVGEKFQVFDGMGQIATATLEVLEKKSAQIALTQIRMDTSSEARFPITLAQGMASSDKMDWLIEKSVELGFASIVPIQTERSVVRLDAERAPKKIKHWQGIVIAACEQSERSVLPTMEPVQSFAHWLSSQTHSNAIKIVLSPAAEMSLVSLTKKLPPQDLTLLIGPEGGLSPEEEEQALRAGFLAAHMGSRILRTETASTAAAAIIHTVWNQWGTPHESNAQN